ncbi:MAG: methyltransferase domain-containing protein [Acidobacteriota bacterium]|nr:methyltransferase domain-containing protein [Acidobacteriota bacterium]
MSTLKGDRSVLGSFDGISPIYDLLSWCYGFGAIQRSRRRLTPFVSPPGRVLVLGDGTGMALCELLQSFEPLQVVCVDASRQMLQRTEKRLSVRVPHAMSRVRLIHGGIEDVPVSDSFDLIVSHYFLDLFDPLRLNAALSRLDVIWEPGGSWWVTDFTRPTGVSVGARLQGAMLRVLYHFFRSNCGITTRTLPDIEGAFLARGYSTQRRIRSAWGTLETMLFLKPEVVTELTGRPDASPSS